MLIQTDARRRITLPPSLGIQPGDALNLKILEDGRIVLIPVEAVPKHQMWAWTTENKNSIVASLSDPLPSIEIATGEKANTVVERWVDEG